MLRRLDEKPGLAAALLGALCFALLWPTLSATRLMDVDEIIHARAALEAFRDGHWLPLTIAGKPWWEKPPLWPWLGGLAMKVAGSPQEWCLRIWPALAASGAVAYFYLLARRLSGAWLPALLASVFFACQLDLVFHARFFTMDSGTSLAYAAALYHLQRSFEAGDEREARGQLWRAAAWLGFGAAVKSYFSLGLFPALAIALSLDPHPRLGRVRILVSLAAGPLLVLAAWLGTYGVVFGPSFLIQEWQVNLWGRATRNIAMDAGLSNFLFYFWHSDAAVPTLIGAGAALWIRVARPLWREKKDAGFLPSFVSVFVPLWTLGLLLVRTQNINYTLPLTLGLSLGLAFWLGRPQGRLDAGVLLWLGVLGLLNERRWLPEGGAFVLGTLSAPLLLLARERHDGPELARKLVLLGALLLSAGALDRASRYLASPPDPNRCVADLLLRHPAAYPGEPLTHIGRWTDSPLFYSRYQVRHYYSVPTPPPRGKLLLEDGGRVAFVDPASGGPDACP